MSPQTQHDPKNEAEIAYWNSAGGRRWVERQQSQDIVLGPILQATLERAELRQGERVVDIGCGTGASSIALAERIGLSGQVLGVDVSAPMLACAAERLPPGAPIKFVRADATTYRFESAAFDLLFSRFGVMFFAEPARAFANLRAALKPSGRLAFACWRKFDENPWLQVPLRCYRGLEGLFDPAALEHVPPLPRPDPEDPGPFSFASEQRVHRAKMAARRSAFSRQVCRTTIYFFIFPPASSRFSSIRNTRSNSRPSPVRARQGAAYPLRRGALSVVRVQSTD
jgi:SAM-dependent methyltransferase